MTKSRDNRSIVTRYVVWCHVLDQSHCRAVARMLPAMHQPTRCAGVAANGSTLKRAIIRVNRVIKPVVACATSSFTDDYDALREVRVLSAANGADVELTALLGRPEGQELVLVPFLTHFGAIMRRVAMWRRLTANRCVSNRLVCCCTYVCCPRIWPRS